MWTALLWKELRECSLYAGLALFLIAQLISESMHMPLIPGLSSRNTIEIPLLSRGQESYFTFLAGMVAVVCGFHQTLWESFRQTTLFLLHRPVPRSRLFMGKLVAGGIVILCAGGLPLLIYCLWAATPGTHASPFAWSMSTSWWLSLLLAETCYLGAFLSGLRAARWIGSRLLPFIVAAAVATILKYSELPPFWIWFGMLLVCGMLLTLIFEEARLREYP